MTGAIAQRPHRGWRGLVNLSFGFFGIQIGFALQNANMSRIFQTLGTRLDDLPVLWIAAPLTGLVVQPLVGHFSDRTWLGRLGRRRPYFLAGAVLAALALVVLPGSASLLVAAAMLWVLDASLNVSMEPFRAFVGDVLDRSQHTAGYAVQTALIGVGAVTGSIFPWLLERWGVANVAPAGAVPDTVRWSFWFGGAALLASVLWTVATTREYPPEDGGKADDPSQESAAVGAMLRERRYGGSVLWIAAGLAVAAAVALLHAEKEMYLLGALLAGYGLASAVAICAARSGHAPGVLGHIVVDVVTMPRVMKQLAVVQFFSWSALFVMWINTTPVVASAFFGTTDPASPAYQQGANWVDVLFGVYNGVAAIAALILLPAFARRVGKARTHAIALLFGAAGFVGFLVVRDPAWLLALEVGIGIAWSAILSMPYAILASSLPPHKLGVYMGVFNAFIVIPQLLVATVMGSITCHFFPDRPVLTMAFAAGAMLIAALAALRVREA